MSKQSKRLDPEVWDRIDRWRAKGWSYQNLATKFKLSKGTLAYRYGKGQKEKALARQQKMKRSTFNQSRPFHTSNTRCKKKRKTYEQKT